MLGSTASVGKFTPCSFLHVHMTPHNHITMTKKQTQQSATQICFEDHSMAPDAAHAASKQIAVGDKVPHAVLKHKDAEGNVKDISTEELLSGKKVVLFAVPGAFTPGCSLKHLPGFIAKGDEIKQAGIDTVACISVNDAFVMDAWGKHAGAGDKVLMLADGSAHFTKALGLELDLTERGLGVRSKRWSAVIEDQVVTHFNLDDQGQINLSTADVILEALTGAKAQPIEACTPVR